VETHLTEEKINHSGKMLWKIPWILFFLHSDLKMQQTFLLFSENLWKSLQTLFIGKMNNKKNSFFCENGKIQLVLIKGKFHEFFPRDWKIGKIFYSFACI
jgi:hypothetical protein